MVLALLGVTVADATVWVGVVAAVAVLVCGALLVRQAVAATGLLRHALDDRGKVRTPSTMAGDPAPDVPPELSGMLAKLDSAQRLNARQFQLQRSQFELFKRMRGDQDPRTLAASILEFVGDHYEAPVGAFYLARPGQRLELAASYGASEEDLSQEFRMGQGVVGRAALRRRILVLNDLEPTHFKLATGLGASAPQAVVVAPFHFAGQVKGVLEMGVAAALDEKDLDFLKLSSESVAMALDSARSRARVHRLLEETRRQAAVLSQQQKELQATNDQLARSGRYKSEFLANMSHELRTPLNSMLIMSQVLAENRDGRLDRSEIEAAETINQAGSELLMIINDILDMSMVESGKLELHPEPVDPRTVAAAVEDIMRPVAEERGLEFKVEVAAEAPRLFVTDSLRVSQVLKNLVGNAVKFTDEGSVTLKVGPADDHGAGEDWLAFTVHDTGIGMDRETRDMVFEVFQQGDGSIARRYGGSGLGLSISRSLAELLGGRIDVASAPGKGSTFTLLLPMTGAEFGDEDEGTILPLTAEPVQVSRTSTPVIAAEEDLESWRGALQGRCVLLADDDMRTVYAISDLLDAMGARVLIARSARECSEQVSAVPEIDVLLLNPVLCSGGDMPDCMEEVDRLGVKGVLLCRDPATIPFGYEWPVLTKPVRPTRLADLCRSLVPAAEKQPV